MRILDTLAKIGLSSQESRVYLALLELQESRTGKLCKHTRITSSNIYQVLDSLIGKGLVSYRVQNNIKVFMPAPPEALSELFLEKQRVLEQERKAIEEVISNLKRVEVKKEPYSNYKYYEGMVGIKSMWHEINNIMSPDNIMRIYTCRKEGYQRLIGFYNEHHRLRKVKRVKAKLIFPTEERALAKKRKNELTEIRFMNLKNEAEWGVTGEYLYIMYITSKKPRGFLVKDKIFAETFGQVFDQLWRQQKTT